MTIDIGRSIALPLFSGVNLCFRPQTSLQFLRLQMLSADGACRAFDSHGTGYVRSETVATVFIQKRQDAKRFYATVLHSKTNTDGWKKDGITFPSGDMQKALIESIYDELHLDPTRVGYVEAHGTGTRAGKCKRERCTYVAHSFDQAIRKR